MDPALQSKIRHYVETYGLESKELLERLQEEALMKLQSDYDKEHGITDDNVAFPAEIKIISQALAYRSATIDDVDEIFAVLTQSYRDEIDGKEAFRSGPSITKEVILQHIEDESFKWLILEAPCGFGVEKDGFILGICCFSTDGVSRKNGVVEGNVCSIRFLGVLKRFQGLCVGRRLLSKVEEQVFIQYNCVRVLVSIPNMRESMVSWVEKRGYTLVGGLPYPFKALKHEPLKEPTNDAEEVYLLQLVKQNPKPVILAQVVEKPTTVTAFGVEERKLDEETESVKEVGENTEKVGDNGASSIKKNKPHRSETHLPPIFRKLLPSAIIESVATDSSQSDPGVTVEYGTSVTPEQLKGEVDVVTNEQDPGVD